MWLPQMHKPAFITIMLEAVNVTWSVWSQVGVIIWEEVDKRLFCLFLYTSLQSLDPQKIQN